ncbi:unnamed protein product [Ectocarpus sp. 12 AP-2014]
MPRAHASCDRQDITRARITQDIGVVAVVDTRGTLLAISSGHSDRGWIKRDVCHDDLEKLNISQVFHRDLAGVIQDGIDSCAKENAPKARTYACDIFLASRTYVTMLIQSDGNLVLEIEDFDRQLSPTNIVDTANVISKLTANTAQVDTVNDFAKAVFSHSAYDRVMTYKFLDDLSGEVIYELKNDDVVSSSFHGMRFPPGDIPLPARRAYVENPVRFIADVGRPSCDFIQKSDDISLSRSFLRGCPAPHKSYLRAMGVKSSLSIAITDMDGNLWGLIAMHSYTKPIVPTIEDRVCYGILSSVASGHVQHIEKIERLALETRVKSLISQIDANKSLGLFFVLNKHRLLEIFDVDSVSLFIPDEPPTTVGESGATLEDLPKDVVAEQLTCGQLESPPRSFACLRVLGYSLMFTRASSYNPVAWAGNPEELSVSELSPDMVMPRQSFEKYLDHQSTHPPPFTKQDRVMLTTTGDLLKSIIHQMTLAQVERRVDQAKKDSHAVEMKSDRDYAFFANMSHELRTPLHAIGGVFETLNNMGHDHVDDERSRSVRRYSRIGLETCSDMMKTLNNILAIVKKTHEQDEIDVSTVMVKEIFSSTTNGLELFGRKNGVSLDIAFDCHTDKVIRIDMHKTIQKYNNICGNAIKFSATEEEGGEKVGVRIGIHDSQKSVKDLWTTLSGEFSGRLVATEHWTREESKVLGKWLVFQTRDHGVGIRAEDMEKVFNKFTQIDDVVKKTFASTGLGLHISILNVKAMRGFLAVASTPGKGSLCFCALPAEVAACDELNNSSDPVADPTNACDSSSEALNFVVVDDSNVNVMIAKKQINRVYANATGHTAGNGKLGVEQFEWLEKQRVSIDGIFMDYHMPVMSGIEASREIRKSSTSVPITMLTADITETSRQNMIAAGADLILLKPSQPR